MSGYKKSPPPDIAFRVVDGNTEVGVRERGDNTRVICPSSRENEASAWYGMTSHVLLGLIAGGLLVLPDGTKVNNNRWLFSL